MGLLSREMVNLGVKVDFFPPFLHKNNNELYSWGFMT